MPPEWLVTAGGTFILINVFLALFNLLPIPPFDGSHIVGGLLPRKWAGNWQKLQSLGMLFFVVLIAATWAVVHSSAGVVLACSRAMILPAIFDHPCWRPPLGCGELWFLINAF